MAAKVKKNGVADELRALMERPDIGTMEGETVRQQMLLSVLRKAVGGDLKTIEFVLDLLGETPQPKAKEVGQTGIVIRLDKGIEELAQ